MSALNMNAAASAIADSTVNDELPFSVIIDAKRLARTHKTSKAYKAEIAAGFVTGRLVPGNISQRQAAALVGVSTSYVAHVLGRKRVAREEWERHQQRHHHHHPVVKEAVVIPITDVTVAA